MNSRLIERWCPVHPLHALWRWLWHNTGLAARLDAPRFFGFVLNRRPVVGAALMALISPFMFWVFDGLNLFRWVPLNQQWYSALIGDIVIAVMVGCYLHLAQSVPEFADKPVFKRRRTHYLWLVFWLLFGLVHVATEWKAVGGWEREFGLNGSYHTFFVYPFLGYMVTMLTIVCFKRSAHDVWQQYKVKLVFILGAFCYMVTLAYDMTHQYAPNGVLKNVYTSPEDGWHNVRIILEWAWAYVNAL